MKTINIRTGCPQQTIEGWGTSLCWWANAAGGWTMRGPSGRTRREDLMQAIFSAQGLNFNIVRYNIGAGDNPAEDQHMFHFRGMPCFQPQEGGAFDKTADQRQVWVLRRAAQLRRGDLITEVFVNSPPWWMTNSQCSAGNLQACSENLSPLRYGEFIDYCVRVLDYLTGDCKLRVDYFSPMNEPASDYWAKGQRQEGNKVLPGAHQSLLLETAHRKLQQRHPEIKIAGTDETNPTVALESYQSLSEPVRQGVLRKINYHHYLEDDSALAALCRIAYPNGFSHPRCRLWMDEVCYGEGEDDFGLAQRLSRAIHKDLNLAHASAWVIWQAMDTLSDNIARHSHWGLIEGMYQDPLNNELAGTLDVSQMGYDLGDTIFTMQYYVMGHYSKYILPGYSILENDGDAFYCVAAVSPGGNTLVVILCNLQNAPQTLELALGGFVPQTAEMIVSTNTAQWQRAELPPGRFTQVELQPSSITTLRFTR